MLITIFTDRDLGVISSAPQGATQTHQEHQHPWCTPGGPTRPPACQDPRGSPRNHLFSPGPAPCHPPWPVTWSPRNFHNRYGKGITKSTLISSISFHIHCNLVFRE
ncbi:hypothetical protein GQ457_08G022040 [Hibiscus cannabinus]